MPTPHEIYKQSQANSWCRVDMLLALYDAALENVDLALAAEAAQEFDQLREHRHKAVRIVLELFAGLDFSYGEVPQQIGRLCEFMHHALLTGDKDNLVAVREILVTLGDAFREIRHEAVQLERVGRIPTVDANVGVSVGG